MSGRPFEKDIKAIKKNVNIVAKNIRSEPVFEMTSIPSNTKKKLWQLNNAMFLFHTAFLSTTLVLGELSLAPEIYKLDLNASLTDFQDYSNYTLQNAPSGWDEPLKSFLRISTKRQTFGLPMTWLVALFFFLSAFFHFGNANLWWKYYIRKLENQQAPTRWIEYTLSASTMILIVSYGAGVRIDVELFMLFILIATTMFFGHLTEVISKKSTSEDSWTLPFSERVIPHLMGYLPQISAWIVILYIYLDNSEGAPDFVTVIIFTELALFFSFGFVQLFVLLRAPSKYVQGELMYQILSLVSKGLLGIIMLSNVIFLGNWVCIMGDELKQKVPQGYC